MFKKKPPQAAAPVPKVAPVPVDQIRVEDKLYSTEKLAELHPGGPIFIRVRSLFMNKRTMALWTCNFKANYSLGCQVVKKVL